MKNSTNIPSTPFVLVETIIFPPKLIFWVSLTAIMLSAVIMYFFSEVMGFDKLFEKKYPKKAKKVHKLVEKHGFYIVAAWSFLPLVPTDLICYTAGIVRMNFWKFIAGVFTGEFLLVLMLTFLGGEIGVLLNQIASKGLSSK